MDDADKAAMLQEALDRAAISKRYPLDEHHGYCFNCGKNVGRAYCNADCREDSERFDRARVRNGL